MVDNNCTDDTARTIAEFADRLPIRRVAEQQQGLAHARNRARSEFRGDVLLFTDDDVTFDADWLASYVDAFVRYPVAAYFGGRILPRWLGREPAWAKDPGLHLIDGLLGWFDHGTATRRFEPGEPTPFGASFAVRRTLFDRIGTFRVDLGTGGVGLGRGEETEFLLRARQAGAEGVYVGTALCFHAVDPSRLTLRALYRYGKASGVSHRAIVNSCDYGSTLRAASFLARGVLQLAKGRGDRFRQCVINAGIQMGTLRPARMRLW